MPENKTNIYELLRIKHEQTDWKNIDSIKEYNEYACQLYVNGVSKE